MTVVDGPDGPVDPDEVPDVVGTGVEVSVLRRTDELPGVPDGPGEIEPGEIEPGGTEEPGEALEPDGGAFRCGLVTPGGSGRSGGVVTW